LAVACVLVGLLAPLAIQSLPAVLVNLTGGQADVVSRSVADATEPLVWVVIGAIVFLLILVAVILLRVNLLAGRRVDEGATWGCGYARPTARMQYTASSFAQPLTDLFRPLLGTRKKVTAPHGIFPTEAALSTVTPDLSREEMYRPIFERVNEWLSQLRWLQQGKVQLYVLYLAVTLIVLLVWTFR